MNVKELDNECMGCGLCANNCPAKCIKMSENYEGFYRPMIDRNLCSNCGLCYNKCPVCQPTIQITPLKVYAAKDKNLINRKKSASGGVAAVFATHIIEQGGVFAGVRYDDDFNVVHSLCTSLDEVDLYRDSKYAQSYTGDIFLQIQEKLDSGQKVIVTGTPCQIAAMRIFFGYSNKDLLLCDFVCHGVPPQRILKNCIKLIENEANKKVSRIFLRDKTDGWKNSNMKVEFENGEEYIIHRRDSVFYKIFGSNYSLQESCYQCKFRNFNTYSDITLGDYWGIEEVYPDFYDNNGVSIVIVNSKKGESFFDEISECFDIIETDIKHAVSTHPKLLKSAPRNDCRDYFLKEVKKDISVKKFKEATDKFSGSNFINKVKRKILIYSNGKINL